MDPFSLIAAGGLAALVVVLVLLGAFHPRSGAEILSWQPSRTPEAEARDELTDVSQMLEAQNALRRRRGAPERTAEEIEALVRRERG